MAYDGPSRLKLLVEHVFGSSAPLTRPLRLPLRLLLHLEIPERHFRNGLELIHPYNVIVHPDAELGRNVTLYHNVTIATLLEGPRRGTPVIGDGVTIFPNSIVLGAIHVGDGAVIGAGSVVTRSVAAGATVAGNPARPTRAAGNLNPSKQEGEAS